MIKLFRALAVGVLIAAFAVNLHAQSGPWSDPSLHKVRFVEVEPNVRLEVLDWGGKGRSVVLLAGLGNSAHVFDEFATKLTLYYHVYGITRRGFGDSSVPETGYTADRLGDDVLAVLGALKIDKPVLVGHSIAGQELSSIGMRFPERVAGLAYLEAAYRFAYDNPDAWGLMERVEELQRNLTEFKKQPAASAQLIDQLLQHDLPGMQKELAEFRATLPAPTGIASTAADRTSYQSFMAWDKRVRGYAFPEAEYRATRSSTDGHITGTRAAGRTFQAIIAGAQRYTRIDAPLLAIFAVPHAQGPISDSATPAERAALDRYTAWDAADAERRAKAIEKNIPKARVVRLPRADHYLFITDEAAVLRELRAFIGSLQ